MKLKVSRFIIYCILGIFITSIAILPVNSVAEENMQIEEYLDYTIGDYFEYNYDIEEMLTSKVEDDDAYTDYSDVTTKNKISITGTETINTLNGSFECWIMQSEIERGFTIIGDNENLIKWIYDSSIIIKQWLNKDTFITTKEEATIIFRNEYTYPEGDIFESVISEYEIVEKTTYSRIEEPNPLPLKVGKTWSGHNTYTINTTTKYRVKLDDEEFTEWNFNYDEEEKAETINYEVISENENVVPAGTFTTLKIKMQIKGEMDYTYIFLDKFGMVVEEQIYEYNTLSEIISLKEYKYEKSKDTDNDGYIDIYDDFPNDPNEFVDTDLDGIGDNSDAFPKDTNETKDTDLDGVGDNSDAFPENANETKDTDLDGVGDNSDAFPDDSAASLDGDNDGYPDKWNTGKTEADSTTGLQLDYYPTDENKWKKEPKEEEAILSTFNLAIITIIIVIVIVVVIILMSKKKKPQETVTPPQYQPTTPQQYTTQQQQSTPPPPPPQQVSPPPPQPQYQTPPPPPPPQQQTQYTPYQSQYPAQQQQHPQQQQRRDDYVQWRY